MKTLFEKIIAREIPAHFIYEDDRCVVIMDKFPRVPGQALIVTKQPIDYFFELDDELYRHTLTVAKRVSLALDKVFGTVRTCMVIEGLEIPHAHIKLYPITEPRLEIHGGSEADDETLAVQAQQVKDALS